MSGRSGYRKTAVRRPRHAMTRHDLTLTFTLPPSLSAFVSAGNRGGGVSIEAFGYVRVTGAELIAVFDKAHQFLASIAKDHPPLCLSAVLTRHASQSSAGRCSATANVETYRISIASGRPVVVIAKTATDLRVHAR